VIGRWLRSKAVSRGSAKVLREFSTYLGIMAFLKKSAIAVVSVGELVV